jgi:hypothetical protein
MARGGSFASRSGAFGRGGEVYNRSRCPLQHRSSPNCRESAHLTKWSIVMGQAFLPNAWCGHSIKGNASIRTGTKRIVCTTLLADSSVRVIDQRKIKRIGYRLSKKHGLMQLFSVFYTLNLLLSDHVFQTRLKARFSLIG